MELSTLTYWEHSPKSKMRKEMKDKLFQLYQKIREKFNDEKSESCWFHLSRLKSSSLSTGDRFQIMTTEFSEYEIFKSLIRESTYLSLNYPSIFPTICEIFGCGTDSEIEISDSSDNEIIEPEIPRVHTRLCNKFSRNKQLSPQKNIKKNRKSPNKWTDSENKILMGLMVDKDDSFNDWASLVNFFDGRPSNNISQHWKRVLSPSIDRGWTLENYEDLNTLVEKYGKRWSTLTKWFPGRTDNFLSYRWKAYQKIKKSNGKKKVKYYEKDRKK